MTRITHFEIHAADPERAIAFYSAVFDWQFQRWGEEPYWLITTGPADEPGINGGLIQRRGENPAAGDGPPVIAYVCTADVADIEATTAAVEANGGAVVVPKSGVGDMGWLVYYRDTEGNIFGAFQNR